MIKDNIMSKPMILAPAGNRKSFLAALVAGSDGVYCGLKNFSARMEAKNFSLDELLYLSTLAKNQGVKVYVTMNTILKSNEMQEAGTAMDVISKYIKPHALIIQDLGLIPLIKKTGFKGQIHLSTLTNVSFPSALHFIRKELDIHNVVLPRELSIDEIKLMADKCPKDLSMEVFVHGALCYGVSGRCYWSSYLGGKSSLRGRCVQPCRRKYLQNNVKQKFFSCCDLSLDVLTKVLRDVPKVDTWKIEGRKKGAHYVFYTVSAYKILRDENKKPGMKKKALYLLDNCLSRYTTHYNFLSHRPQNPIKIEIQTTSGLLVGKIKGRYKNFFVSRQELIPGDILRVGYEDSTFHFIIRVSCHIPQKGKFHINTRDHRFIKTGTPVFLKDRMEKSLEKKISTIEQECNFKKSDNNIVSNFSYSPIKVHKSKSKIIDMQVSRKVNKSAKKYASGVWLYDTFLKDIESLPNNHLLWIWLPPVIWPMSELNIRKLINEAIKKGICNFVLNVPWQMAFFEQYKFLNIWAGPFCNISNSLSLQVFKNMGFSGALVSPELSLDNYIELASASQIPVGIIIYGNWPLCISHCVSNEIKTEHFFESSKNEGGWVSKYGQDYWIFPDWRIDITDKRDILVKAGYKMFINLVEIVPQKIKLKNRPGLWNLKIGLR